jgi:hypothetical protein
MQVFDRVGVELGRVGQVHRGDPLAVADDGRRIGQGDLAFPGWFVRRLPGMSPQSAARLTRSGYFSIVPTRQSGARWYAALTDVARVNDDNTVELAMCLDDIDEA